jgi:sortase (surface protein transpeptidase)
MSDYQRLRRQKLIIALICFAVALALPFLCAWQTQAAGDTLTFADQSFAIVGAAPYANFQHDTNIIYRLSYSEDQPNYAFAAHSDSAGVWMYRLSVGDTLTLTENNHTSYWRVTQIQTVITNYFFVNPSWFMRSNTLMMFTCYPIYDPYPTGRLIITAERMLISDGRSRQLPSV